MCTYIYIYYVYKYMCVRIYIYISRVVTPLNSSCTFRSNRGVRPGLDWSLVTSRACEHGPFSSLICHFCYEKTCYPHVKLGHEACNGPAVFSSFQSQIFVSFATLTAFSWSAHLFNRSFWSAFYSVLCLRSRNSNAFNHEFEFLNAKKKWKFSYQQHGEQLSSLGIYRFNADHFLSMHCVPCVLCPRLRLLRVNSILT